jgi:hypothetical protein
MTASGRIDTVEREEGRDSGSVQPATVARVWLSRLGTAAGSEIEGSLSLTPTHLRFDHRRGTDDEHVPLTAITKVKRPVGSSVLFVEYLRQDGELTRLAFFFAQPPPAVGDDVSQIRARRKRSDNAGFMWQQAGNVAELVKSWRNAVRAAMKKASAGD